MTLKVTQLSIKETMDELSNHTWQIPKFQRDFIWTQTQIYELLKSIFLGRPIGLLTLWAQPQGTTHTAHEPVTYKKVIFGGEKDQPAIIDLVLDGRQRLTTLAIAFGGLRPPNASFSLSGDWFLDLDADPDDDKFIVYLKRSEVNNRSLTQMSNCLSEALIPLNQCNKLNEFNQNIKSSHFYPNQELPEESILNKRSERIAMFLDIYKTFQIPVARIPSTVTLSEVCEIFDVLNTTGTKVSTFDLIHNLLYADTTGKFNLRELFTKYKQDYNSLSLLLDEDRPDFFNQIVTGCYIGLPEKFRLRRKPTDKKKYISSIKGGELVETPTPFYEEFNDEILRIDTFASQIYTDVFGSEFKLKELPYPVSIILYLSLRWKNEKVLKDREKFDTQKLNSLFRAFFWRNAISGRYDQGFLTLFSTDLNKLSEILITYQKDPNWANVFDQKLTEYFGKDYEKDSLEDLIDNIKNGELRGAFRQALAMHLYTKVRHDIVSGDLLDRSSNDRSKKVELHHIYPNQHCIDIKGDFQILQDCPMIVQSIANLVPLSADSNKKWKTRSPGTAILDFELTTDDHKQYFREAFIPDEAYEILAGGNSDPEKFWNIRAKAIATEICELQNVK